MKEVQFNNKRFDNTMTPFEDIAKQLAEAFGYTADLQLDKQLAQLCRLRVANLNECAFCIILHSKASRDAEIPHEKIDNISSWYNSDLYSEKEKAALNYTDALSHGKGKDFQKYHDALVPHFNQQEIAELAAVVVNMNLWTRWKLAHGQTPYFEK